MKFVQKKNKKCAKLCDWSANNNDTQNEIEVVRYLKKKQADNKHRTSKKQSKLDGKLNLDDGTSSTSTSENTDAFNKYNNTYFYKMRKAIIQT